MITETQDYKEIVAQVRDLIKREEYEGVHAKKIAQRWWEYETESDAHQNKWNSLFFVTTMFDLDQSKQREAAFFSIVGNGQTGYFEATPEICYEIEEGNLQSLLKLGISQSSLQPYKSYRDPSNHPSNYITLDSQLINEVREIFRLPKKGSMKSKKLWQGYLDALGNSRSFWRDPYFVDRVLEEE